MVSYIWIVLKSTSIVQVFQGEMDKTGSECELFLDCCVECATSNHMTMSLNQMKVSRFVMIVA